MGEWKEVCLDDISEMKYGKMPNKEDIIDKGYPIYSGYRITGYHKDFMFEESQLIVVARGVGGTGDVKLSPPKCFLTNLSIAILLNEKIVSKKYMYYYFQKLNLRSLDTGSAQSQITISDLKRYNVILPPLPEQKAIADTLSALDDKIDLNNRINKTLEEMAQAIFKSWFVDFEPFQDGEFEDSELGRIPKGWRVDNLDNIADFLNGLAMQKYRPVADEFIPVIKIRELNQGMTDDNSDRARIDLPKQYIIQNGDIIFSWSGTLMVKIWTGGKGGLNQHLFKVSSIKYEKWFYYLWTCYHLEKFKAIAQDKATTMGHIKRGHLTEAKVLIPNDNELEALDEIFKPIIEKIIEVNVQNQTLIAIRDSLLPKLMSGEIRVV